VTSLIIFIASLLVAHLFLGIERLAGIDWDFHPDAIVYIFDYEIHTSILTDIPNNLYFFVSSVFSGNVWLLIELNIFAYALANTLGCRFLSQGCKHIGLDRRQTTILILIFLCQPYRLHLAVHVLKDTFIFLLLVFVIGSPTLGKRMVAIIFILALRLSSILYLLSQIPRKIMIGLFAIIFSVILMQQQELLQFLLERNEVNMGGRDFNTVPNFVSYGLWGTSLRGLTWPVLLVTGTFWFFSPIMIFLPISMEMLLARILQARMVQLPVPWLPVLVSLGLMAIMVNSFTAYLRYAYPLVCILPMMAVQMKKKMI
jgi:hypothetical protein